MRQLLALILALATAVSLSTPALAQLEPLSAESAFADAFSLYDAGLYGQAALSFETFRTNHPAHVRYPDALFYGGQAELAAGRDARAADLLGTFRRRYPAHPLAPRARLALGEYHFARGDYEQAATSLREALDESQPPDEAARALLMIGHASLRLGQTDAAVRDLRRVADEYPRSDAAPRALYAIGVAETERADYTAAAEAFSRLATRYRRTPEDRMVGLALAEALLRTGQLTSVVSEVDRRLLDVPDGDQEGGLPLAPLAASERQARRDRGNFLAGEALLRLSDRAAAEERFNLVSTDGLYAARASFGLARIAFDRQEWQDAADRFTRAHETAPAGHEDLSAEALYYAGLAQQRSGRLDRAITSFARSAELDPQGLYADVALYEKGILQYTIRQWDEAAVTFDRLLTQHPTSTYASEAARMLGETYAALGDYRRAEQASARAQQLGAASPALAGEVEFQRGYQAVQAGDYAAGEQALMAVYERNPAGERGGEALFWAAEAAFQRGQRGERDGLTRARDRFTSFLQAFPDHRQRDAARYALAWTHFKRGDYARAAEAYERFLAAYRPGAELVPYTADARLRLADSYFALRRWDDAAAAYRRVEGAGADYARFQIGQALANAGRTEEAIAAYSRLLSDFPDSQLRPQARYGIGDLRFQQGNYDRAIEIFQEVIAQYPRSPVAARAQFAIGDARFNQGRLADAAAAYRAVLDRYPRSPLVPDAVSAIELALSGLGREDEVVRVVQRFEEQNPDATAIEELRFRQAEGRFQRGDFRGAIEDLQTLLQRTRDPDLIPPTLIYLGRAHANLGDRSRAEAQFRRVIDQHPDSPLRAEASRRLGNLMLEQNRFQDALPLFRSAASEADTAADGAEARMGEAAALVGLGRLTEAEPLLLAVVREAPSAALTQRARMRLADLYETSGRRDRAWTAYEEVAREDDGAVGAEAASRLATSLMAANEAQRVISVTDQLRIEERYAGFPVRVSEILLARARAFRRLGQSGRAQEAFDRITRAYSETPAAAVARRERDA